MLVLLLFIISPIWLQAQSSYNLITEEWAPYNFTENGKLSGFSTEIVQALLEELNLEDEIRVLPSMRATSELNRIPRTMMFSMFRTAERESRYKWIGPLADASIYFYKRKDDPRKYKSLSDLKKVETIACRHDGLIPKLLEENGFKNLDMTSTNSQSIYRKLIEGRCDIGIGDTDLGARHQLKSIGIIFDEVAEKIDIPLFSGELYIACGQGIKDEEIDLWMTALETIKAKGIYDRILSKYL